MLTHIANLMKQIRPYIVPGMIVTIVFMGSFYKLPVNAQQKQQRTPQEQHKRNTEKSMFGILGGGALGGGIVGAAAGGPWAPLGILGGGLLGGLVARGVRKNKERRINGVAPVSRQRSGSQVSRTE